MKRAIASAAVALAIVLCGCNGRGETPGAAGADFFALAAGNEWRYSCECPLIGASDAEARIDSIDEKNFPGENAYVWVMSFQGLSPVKRWFAIRNNGLYLLQEEGRGILAQGIRRFDPAVLFIKTPMSGGQNYESTVRVAEREESHRFDVIPQVEVSTQAGTFETYQIVHTVTAGSERTTSIWNFVPQAGFVQITLPGGDGLKLAWSNVASLAADGGAGGGD